MAIVFIKDIQTRLDKTLSYIGNKKKTLNENYEDVFLDLHNALEYTVDDLKTEQKFFVEGVNCKYENAFKRMMEAKKEYGKTDGILGYHIIQSFAPGEGTPESIYELGKEFARRAFGDRFEVVVATHLNTGCLHNHFVLNSVSFMDGKKYYDTNESYAMLRKISDDLCKEYGLSVIENPKKRSHKSYDLYMAEKNGEWTKDAIIRRDIDECIKASTSPKGFYREMQKRGYTFNFNRKYPTVSHPNFERPRRLKTLGEDYTPERIEERVMADWRKYVIEIPQQDNLVEDFFMPLNNPSYQEVYVSFVTVVGYVKKNPRTNRELDKYLISEMRKLDKLIEQQNLVCGNNIETAEQLSEFKEGRKSELNEVEEARRRLRNMLKVAIRADDEKEIAEIKDAISNLTERAKILRKDIRVCERIETTEPEIENKINTIMNDKQRKEMTVDERFGRCSRTNREDVTTGR
ncbi:MAG: relaxase/mobilization nuclease domain-containing protein [Acutalibacteraceae bacterium]|nr:relaxase/mobilization nuclease domain-containing protein [Acutalibacteraceae bacterium]